MPRGDGLSAPEGAFFDDHRFTGHVGAAFGPLLVGYLWQLSKVGRLRGPNALVHLSSTQSLRGALVLSQPSNQS